MVVTVRSKEEAWKLADRLFPTDYEKDEKASENAGYKIYSSAAEGVNAWISDLGNCLELNYEDGTRVMINVQHKRFPKVYVGIPGKREVFGKFKVPEIQEQAYLKAMGVEFASGEETAVVIHHRDGIATFMGKNISYIRFEEA